MRLMVISAMSRDSSTTYILAKRVVEICSIRGVEVDFVTPADVNVPVNDGTVPFDLPEAVALAAARRRDRCLHLDLARVPQRPRGQPEEPLRLPHQGADEG